MKKILELYKKYKEIINYLIFGGLATVVNFVSYYIFARTLNVDEVISSGLSWFCSVLFAYVTNKLFVFVSLLIFFSPKYFFLSKVYQILTSFYTFRINLI